MSNSPYKVIRALGWLQANLLGTPPPEQLSFEPTIIPIVDASVDWPLTSITKDLGDLVSVAGNATQTLAPDVGRHMLVLNWGLWASGVAFPATDTITLQYMAGTLGSYMMHLAGKQLFTVPLIGGRALTTADPIWGLQPVYVAYPNSLFLTVASLAGGTTYQSRIVVIDLPATSPMPMLR